DAADAQALDLGTDSQLPAAPADLLSATTFDLTRDEADYLQSTFVRLAGDTVLTRMAARPELATGERVWSSPAMDVLPDEMREHVDHSRRLHHAWHGAPLLYNLM